MVDGLAEQATKRQVRLLEAIQRLGDDDVRARDQRSYRDNHRTIEEWQAFVESLDLAHRVMREWRRSDGR